MQPDLLMTLRTFSKHLGSPKVRCMDLIIDARIIIGTVSFVCIPFPSPM